jgi:hypothetical protein
MVFYSKVSLEAFELLAGKKSKQSVFSLQFIVSCFSFQINRNFNLVEFYSLNYAQYPNEQKNYSFDGVCNLCDSAVQFIIKHDTNDLF